MQKKSSISEFKGFYKQLFKKLLLTTTVVVTLSLSYVLFASLNVTHPFLSYIIVFLAFIKTFFIVRLTFIQLSKIIGESHKLSHVLILFGVLILLIVFSFCKASLYDFITVIMASLSVWSLTFCALLKLKVAKRIVTSAIVLNVFIILFLNGFFIIRAIRINLNSINICNAKNQNKKAQKDF